MDNDMKIKQKYETPTLVEYGDIKDITRSAGAFGNDGGVEPLPPGSRISE